MKAYSQTSSSKASSASERMEALLRQREQLEQDAERLGLNKGDNANPLAASHRSIVAKIDAELEVLKKQQAEKAPSAAPAEETTAVSSAQEVTKQPIIQRVPNKKGVYPPGTFLDIYA